MASFWRGKRVFLTGHTGFKGSWLSLWLQSLGAEVHGFSLPPATQPALFVEAQVDVEMHNTFGDIRDFDQFSKSVKSFQPEIVIHMAAQATVRTSYIDPVETISTNVLGTTHLLEAIRYCGSVKAVVNVTTDKCYENNEWVWGYRESEPMGGHDPYSASKGCSELVTAAYRRSFLKEAGIHTATARAGNVIGGGDWAEDRLIPDLLRAFEKGVTPVIRNPHSIRPWQHVLEPLSGYLLLAQRLYQEGEGYAEGWNFGPADEDAKTVESIANVMAESWGDGADWILDGNDQPHEAQHLKLDISKARMRLGWRPSWSLRTTLGKIVDWHRAWINGGSGKTYCLKQIAEHQNSH
ncbi:CDP-glucose 4,6-dehydratase [Arenicellales bacterium nBUS_48]